MEKEKALEHIAQSVRSLHAYHLDPLDLPVKLNQNENPFSWPPALRESLAEFCRSSNLNRYPDFVPDALKKAIASYAGVEPDQILAGNGSNEILMVLFLTLLSSHKKVILCQPTFTVYQLLARGMGVEPLELSLSADLEFDVNEILRVSAANPDSLLILCSPNNPTGCALSKDDLDRILAKHRGFFILDQAYVEFGGYNAASLTRSTPNLIITRTFSKALGAAGLRLGYLIGHPDIVSQIVKMKLPYNVNRFTEFAGITILADKDRIAAEVAFLRRERDSLAMVLQNAGLGTVYPSQANFLLIRHTDKDRLFAHLKEQGILVRDVSAYPLLENCLRINVGTSEENRLLRNAIAQYVN